LVVGMTNEYTSSHIAHRRRTMHVSLFSMNGWHNER
jgi:hypothetical protein